ncbi:MAG: response regulator transcription factor [Ignavibacteriota bacterium]|jgi:two-component system alkaline phosphatase synthesis response regulator PhoP|nr:MAG: DNA-binding response regulator [Chlorobiota bacterium]MBE7477385.1 response regulator transcription factor [Ignavibacteriales bacterium]MBL1122786.1 DNA-binding response regulator [Ignavibacteriota bacterium]MCC7094255.1 response regulator transcription factor [Ignavibacteriaceae bacterium]MCE7855807.1 DNA-binding response regulator [Ignavibacteria bacterium CHB3]MEB2296321.1 response regulator transcription factor [Ignavibacteria bacterium]
MSKILLVDDEPDILEFLKYNLEQEDFEVLTSTNGKDALKKILLKPDLIILDIMMPEMDGFELYQQIKSDKNFRYIPIIFLTAKSGETNEIKGLDLGASDYIQKPISPKKLIARIKSNLRKSAVVNKKEKSITELNVGPLIIDTDQFMVKINNKKKYFPRKEFQLLYFLASNPGKVMNRDTLLKEIWGNDVFVVDRTIDVHIRKIREKLGKHSEIIETIKGVGYRFKLEQ